MFDLPYLSSKYKTTQASVRTEHLYYKYIDYWIEPLDHQEFILFINSTQCMYINFSLSGPDMIYYIFYT